MTGAGLSRDEGALLLRGLLDAGCELPAWLRNVAAPSGTRLADIPGQRRSSGPASDTCLSSPIGDDDTLDVTRISLAHLGLGRTEADGSETGTPAEAEAEAGAEAESKTEPEAAAESEAAPEAGHEDDLGAGAEDDVDHAMLEATTADSGTGIDLLALYRSFAQRAPLLTPDQEVDLATRIEAGVLARERLRERPDMAPELAAELRQVEADGEKSFDTFVESNLRLVVSIVWKYRNRGIEILDMIQDGNLGLVRSVQKFDHALGCRFSTYGVWWIRQGIARGITDHARTIRYPTHVNDRLRRIETVSRAGGNPFAGPAEDGPQGHAGTDDELGRIWWQTLPTTLSLDHARERLGADELDEVLLRFADAPVTEMYGFPLDAVRDVLAACPERERYVLARRHGLLGERATLETIGGELGVTRERVRQVENRAASRVRAAVARVLREVGAERGSLGPTHPDATPARRGRKKAVPPT